MPDSAITTTKDKLSRQRIQPAAPGAPAPGARRDHTEVRPLSDLAHDEWCELCDDLERLLEG